MPRVAEHVWAIAVLANDVDVVLVEGAGGLVARLDSRLGTLADIGTALRYKGISTGYVLVASPCLGTLNHTALTRAAFLCWERRSGRSHQSPALLSMQPARPPAVANAPLLGMLPRGAGVLPVKEFALRTPDWLFRA